MPCFLSSASHSLAVRVRIPDDVEPTAQDKRAAVGWGLVGVTLHALLPLIGVVVVVAGAVAFTR